MAASRSSDAYRKEASLVAIMPEKSEDVLLVCGCLDTLAKIDAYEAGCDNWYGWNGRLRIEFLDLLRFLYPRMPSGTVRTLATIQ